MLALPVAERLKKRYQKFRAHGHVLEKCRSRNPTKRKGLAIPPRSSFLRPLGMRPDRAPGLSVLYPLTFHPLFKERVWGGAKPGNGFTGNQFPPGIPIGESWEISDRPGDVSVIVNGPLAGKRPALADGTS
jgi:hypothetical protein